MCSMYVYVSAHARVQVTSAAQLVYRANALKAGSWV